MPIRVACPACDTVINAPDSAGGQVAHCPKCKSAMRLPDAAAELEVVDKPSRKSVPPDDDDDRAISRYPSLRKKHGMKDRRDDDDFDDRPRKPRREDRDDDYDDDRPRKKTNFLPLIITGGVLLFALLVGLGLWAGGVFDKKKGGQAGPASAAPKKPWTKGPPPPGWSFVDGDRFACFLPGKVDVRTQATGPTRRRGDNEWHSGRSGDEECDAHAYEFENRTVGNTQALLFKEFKDYAMRANVFEAGFYENQQQKFRPIAGMPGLVVTSQDKLGFAKPPNYQPTDRDRAELNHYTALVFGKGSRLYILQFTTKGKPLSDADIKTISDSFEER